MATPYSDVFNVFLGKITDYDLPKFNDIDREDILEGYMVSACVKFNKVCLVDLYDRNNDSKQFNNDLDDEIIDIITENMLVEWLKPKLLSTENLENALSTKDFSLFSPANLLGNIRETMKEIRKEAKVLINNYSFNHASPERLTEWRKQE